MAKPRLKHNTWIVVADGGRALIMRNDGDAEAPNFSVVRKYGEHVPPTREQGTDKPGRTNASVGVNRSAIEQTDFHAQAEERFLREIAAVLTRDHRNGQFASLVVAAAPIALGVLRRAMSEDVKKAVMFEIGKDFTKMPVHEIEQALSKALEAA
jgi:protein required for attachment to host cells